MSLRTEGAPVDAPLAARLKAVGRAAGLDAVGFASAEPFDDTRRVLESRRAEGLSGGMQFTYRNPARSTDPDRALPGACSLIVGARSYVTAGPAAVSADGPAGSAVPAAGPVRPTGRVASYAREDHYGDLRASLQQVAAVLRTEGYRARVLVDDNALVDRAAAQRAGLGWFGKNATILLPAAGSWFVLGSVVTDAALPPDEPVEDGCGTCHRCLDACPTGALVAPGVLDGRRCLAWLVQAPGVFPLEYRQAVGDRIYGCDDCQDVCPVNKLAARRDPPPAPGEGAVPAVDVLGLLAASDEELLSAWGRWYIAERDPRYLRRNALIVLGNTGDPGDPEVIRAVMRALADDEPLVRAHAVWAAARLGRGDLIQAVVDDPDVMVRAEVLSARSVPASAVGSGA